MWHLNVGVFDLRYVRFSIEKRLRLSTAAKNVFYCRRALSLLFGTALLVKCKYAQNSPYNSEKCRERSEYFWNIISSICLLLKKINLARSFRVLNKLYCFSLCTSTCHGFYFSVCGVLFSLPLHTKHLLYFDISWKCNQNSRNVVRLRTELYDTCKWEWCCILAC